RFEAAAGGQPARIKATLKILENASWLWSMIAEAVADGRPFVGLSVDFVGAVRPATRDGSTVKEVQAMRQLLSVDVVTRPSAGGRFERILNAERPPTQETEEKLRNEPNLMEAQAEQLDEGASGAELLSEAQRLLEAAQLERRVAESERALDGLLSASKLPDVFKAEVRKRFTG